MQRLDTQLYEPTNKNPLKKSLKSINQRIRKRYYKTLGTKAMNSPLSSLSLGMIISATATLYIFNQLGAQGSAKVLREAFP